MSGLYFQTVFHRYERQFARSNEQSNEVGISSEIAERNANFIQASYKFSLVLEGIFDNTDRTPRLFFIIYFCFDSELILILILDRTCTNQDRSQTNSKYSVT